MRFSTAAMATDSPGVVASLKPKQAACATDAMSAAGSASARTATQGAAQDSPGRRSSNRETDGHGS